MGGILITGATGFVGGRLARTALARGIGVAAFTRREWAGEPAVPAEARFLGALPGDIPPAAFLGADTVVHCAAYAGKSARVAEAVNAAGTVRLAEMARAAGVRAFVHVSSSSARPDAPSEYGRSKHAGERAVLGIEGLAVVVVRPNLVVGPGQAGVFGRMREMVRKMPVLPLLGGGRAIVQPIHVDDLCEAILRCRERADELAGATLNLGHPEGITLAELLQTVSRAVRGRRRIALPVPLWPVKAAVRAAEALGLRLPVSSANLEGLERIEKADTGPDLARLGLELRPLADLGLDEPPPEPAAGGPVRVLLVGAGRAGLIHAAVISRLKGVVLDAIVDPNRRAAGLLRGIGIRAPWYPALKDALARRPDAAVVATPVSSHLRIARELVVKGAGVLVEKPLAGEPEQLPEYARLQEDHARTPLHPGWVMLRNPHIAVCLERLRAGEYGKVRSFTGWSLLSSVHDSRRKRWEVRRAESGGGAYIAAGGHVLSMIHAAFGDPARVAATSCRLHSREVEDSLVAEFEYSGFRGTHYCSWSFPGLPRLESALAVRTDAGMLTLTPAAALFRRGTGETEIVHQLDSETRFNMAPDYAGAGFTAEIAALADAVRAESPSGAGLYGALDLERLLFDVYEACREVRKFAPPANGAGPDDLAEPPDPASPAPAGGAERYLDLRDSSAPEAAAAAPWDAFVVFPEQVARLRFAGVADARIRVTVPDFLGLSRLIFAGRSLEFLRRVGPAGLARAGCAAAKRLAAGKGATLWTVADGLIAAAVAALRRNFTGTLLLNPHLADLALAAGRHDELDSMLRRLRERCPRARRGVHTGMAREAFNGARLLDEEVDEVSCLSSPGAALPNRPAVAGRDALSAMPGLRATVEVGNAPAAVHRLAASTPSAWTAGAAGVTVGGAAEPLLAGRREDDFRRAWERAFPGLGAPALPR